MNRTWRIWILFVASSACHGKSLTGSSAMDGAVDVSSARSDAACGDLGDPCCQSGCSSCEDGGCFDAGGGSTDAGKSAPCTIPAGSSLAQACLQQLASGRDNPAGPALDGSNVFWTEMQAGNAALAMVPADGGNVTVVLSSAAAPVAIGGGNVYLGSARSAVMPVRLDVGRQPIPFQGFGRGIGANSTAIYFNDGAGLTIAPIHGGAPVRHLPPGSPDPSVSSAAMSGLALDATHVYWGNVAGGNGTDSGRVDPAIWIASLDGSSATLLAGGGVHFFNPANGIDNGQIDGGAPIGTPVDVALDSTHVYWTDTVGNVSRIPISGGAPEVLATGFSGANDLAVDDSACYWTRSSYGEVWKQPLAGGAAIRLTAGQDDPRGIVVDATSVYWVAGHAGDGSVFKLTPK